MIFALPILIFILVIFWIILCLGKEKLEFSGWKEVEEEPNNRYSKENDSLHFVIYGKTGSGKTHFAKEYTSFDTDNVVVFCKDKNDWIGYETHSENDLKELENMELFTGKTVILDDMGGYFKHNSIDDIFSKGRHYNIKLIVMGHKAADVTNKGRGNINLFYCTTQNSDAFFDDIIEKFSSDDDIRNYKDVEYGIIRYDLIKNSYLVIDKHKNIIFDSNKPTLNINTLKYKKTFTRHEKLMIGKYLKSRLVEPDEYDPSMFEQFLNNYLIEKKVRPEPGVAINFKNGLANTKPYIDTINSTYLAIGGICSLLFAGYIKYNQVMNGEIFPPKKNLLVDNDDVFTDDLEEERNKINKELRRRRSISAPRRKPKLK